MAIEPCEYLFLKAYLSRDATERDQWIRIIEKPWNDPKITSNLDRILTQGEFKSREDAVFPLTKKPGDPQVYQLNGQDLTPEITQVIQNIVSRTWCIPDIFPTPEHTIPNNWCLWFRWAKRTEHVLTIDAMQLSTPHKFLTFSYPFSHVYAFDEVYAQWNLLEYVATLLVDWFTIRVPDMCDPRDVVYGTAFTAFITTLQPPSPMQTPLFTNINRIITHKNNTWIVEFQAGRDPEQRDEFNESVVQTKFSTVAKCVQELEQFITTYATASK